MTETDEQERYYRSVSVGDSSPAPRLMQAEQMCRFKFHTPGEDSEDAPWVCTRLDGHAPPHVAETLTRIVAIHREEDPGG